MKKITLYAIPRVKSLNPIGVRLGDVFIFSPVLPTLNEEVLISLADVAAQTREILDEIKSRLGLYDLKLEDIFQVNISLVDCLGELKEIDKVYEIYFEEVRNMPVRNIQSVASLPFDAMVQIQVLAVKS